MDRVVPFLPGVYASIEKRSFRSAWTRSGFYPGVREEHGLSYQSGGSIDRYLFSFVGSARAHPVRVGLLGLDGAPTLLLNSDTEPVEREVYSTAMRDSAFVLCPRGGGSSTFRLFEAMMLGRAPVVISDQWVAPLGPDWGSFSIRVAEDEINSIPRLLLERAGEAKAMGEAAREAWVGWFSPQAAFHRTVEWCMELECEASRRAGWRRYAPHLEMLRPYHAARKLAKSLGHDRGATA
ncbi:MAG TPA: exostosin family protein [Fimbriimonas sp.]|nr:exostosin family protein [Fimbriimonas sp.]